MQTVTADPLVGRLLEGRYRILDRIARGGMSTVYSAVDERLDRLVAVKVMSAALSADPAFSDRFAHEARAAARLTHVNAVAVYDQGHDTSGGHHVFLVMELVEGRTLRDLIRERNGRFTPAEALSIMEPVLGALASAHRAGLVHRDVKPENILLSDAGIVKVADFGLARAVDADATSTRTGLMMGTVAYCAPEQLTRGHADPRSDVYAAGIVLFELLTGRPPYQGDSAMNVAYQHVHSRVPAPSSRVKGVPDEIDELVVAATDSDSAGRPSDAASFLAELADIRAALALPIMPVPPRRRDHAGTPVRRPPRPSPVTDSQHTDVVASIGFRHDTRMGPGTRPGRRDDDALPPPVVIPPPKKRKQRTATSRRRRRSLLITLIVLLIGAVSLGGGYLSTHWWQAWNSHVPDLVHRSLGAAEKELIHDHYKVGHITNIFSESAPKGTVIDTTPTDGARLQQSKRVDLTVSRGKDRIAVPDVSAMRLAAAEVALQNRGIQFDPDPSYAASTTVRAGLVISTNPTAAAQIKRNAVVHLVVSSGPPYLDIPIIPQGTTFADAQRTLQQATFAVARTNQYDDNVPSGAVISVSPSGQAAQGGKITVTVSKGPEYVTMPTIASLTSFNDASAQLKQLGLRADRRVVFGDGTRDVVVGQDTKAGTQVHVGDHVVLDVV